MCAEKVHRILMACVLGIALMFWSTGNVQIFVMVQTLVIIMLLVWAFTNFCPSLWILKKGLPSCKWDDK